MDPSYLPNEPNRVAEIYRNYRPIVVPIEVEKRLDFIDILEDGSTILGSSNLSGRYWRGSVWYFENASLAPEKENCKTGIECDSSVCDGKFIDSKKTIIIGEDSGTVTIFGLIEEDDQTVSFEQKSSRHDHDNCVLSIAVSQDKQKAVTGGMDLCIKVWDTQELIPSQTYHCAHSNHVTGVAFSSDSSSHLFASCGLDGAVLVWDTRQPKPATAVVDNPKEGMTALTWEIGNSDIISVGSAFGTVFVYDLRTCGLLKQSSPFKRSIYKLLSISSSSLAGCADSHEVKVIDPSSENLTIKYENVKHSDFVRGLCYDEKLGVLYSCGWDKLVVAHHLEP